MWRRGVASPERRTSSAVRACDPAEVRTPSAWSDGVSIPEVQDNSARRDGPEELERAIAEFRAAHSDSVISARRVITPLLDLWSVAVAVDTLVAQPIQVLLTALVERNTTTASELGGCLDEVEGILVHAARS